MLLNMEIYTSITISDVSENVMKVCEIFYSIISSLKLILHANVNMKFYELNRVFQRYDHFATSDNHDLIKKF